MKWKFWQKKRIEKQEVDEIFDLSSVFAKDFDLMLKYGKPSDTIGKWKSKPFIELPYGIVKKDLPNYQKQNLIIETIELTLECQFKDFKISKATGNEVVGFLLWIRSQQEFINEIEKQNLQTEPEVEMVAAGLHLLNPFGELVTIDSLAKGNVLEYANIESLPYFKVYEKLKLDKTHREIEKRYQKIIEEKSKRKG